MWYKWVPGVEYPDGPQFVGDIFPTATSIAVGEDGAFTVEVPADGTVRGHLEYNDWGSFRFTSV